ncbi:MAG: F0F1 ATP synthase subunit delta [Patescibacteria group bacterium]
MRPTASQYAQALEELVADTASAKVPAIVENLFGFLRRRGERAKLEAIVQRLEKIEMEKRGQLAVTVTTAHAPAKAVKEKLISRAEKLFPGKRIDMRYEVDADMVGGARFRTDEVSYDATLATELKSLKTALMK